MSYQLVIDLARQAMMFALFTSAPLLLTALCVGLVISLIQAVTQVQEQTVAFVTKLAAVGVVFLFLLSWLLQNAVRYTTELLRMLPQLGS